MAEQNVDNQTSRIVIKTDKEFHKKLKIYCLSNNITIRELVLNFLSNKIENDDNQ